MALTLIIPSDLTIFGPGLRISLYGNRNNDVNISGSTLDDHEEE